MACLLLSTAAGAHVADVPTAAVVQHFSISAGDQGRETRCKQLPEKLALMTSTPGLTAEARCRRRCWSKGRYRGCQPKAEEHRVPLLRGTCKAWSTVRGRWPDRISHPSAPHATAGTLLPEICGLVYRSGPACRDTVTRTIVCSWVAASPPAVEWRPANLAATGFGLAFSIAGSFLRLGLAGFLVVIGFNFARPLIDRLPCQFA